MSNSMRPQESQHARPPCPSPSPRFHSNSCPSSRWCHPAISSSVIPFSSCPQSLPASESFPMSQLFTWGGQSTGVSALASVLLKNTRTDIPQNGLVESPCSPRDSQASSPTPRFKSINSSAGPSKFVRTGWSSHCAAWRILAQASVVLRQGMNHSLLFPPEMICSCPLPLWVIWVEFCLWEIHWYSSPLYIEGYYPQSFRLENRNQKKIDELPKMVQ